MTDIETIAARMRQWAEADGGFYDPANVRAILDDRDALTARLAEAETSMDAVHPSLKIDVQKHRDVAYQGGWDDGYAEGYSKAAVERDAIADLLRRAGEAIKRSMSCIETAEYDDYTMQELNAILAKIESRKGVTNDKA